MSLDPTALETLGILADGTYIAATGDHVDIAEPQRAAVRGTRVYPPDQLASLLGPPAGDGEPVTLEVSDETTQAAAWRQARRGGDVAVLNFASAVDPGGGFLHGARAQEEDLCRCSGLYPCIEPQRAYYEANRREGSPLYTDHMLYSPSVPFFRVTGHGQLLAPPFVAGVITAPAPNLCGVRVDDPELLAAIEATFRRRWAMVLGLARAHGHRVVVLGAWGCGAFRNDPTTVAAAIADVLAAPRFAGAFERVIFPIPTSSPRSRANHQRFRAMFVRRGLLL